MSEGYVGRIQYLIALQTRVLMPRPGAGNVSRIRRGSRTTAAPAPTAPTARTRRRCNDPAGRELHAGRHGPGVVAGRSAACGMMLRRGTGGYYVNGVVARWPRARSACVMPPRTSASPTGTCCSGTSCWPGTARRSSPRAASTTRQYSVDLTANAIEVSAPLPPACSRRCTRRASTGARLDAGRGLAGRDRRTRDVHRGDRGTGGHLRNGDDVPRRGRSGGREVVGRLDQLRAGVEGFGVERGRRVSRAGRFRLSGRP